MVLYKQRATQPLLQGALLNSLQILLQRPILYYLMQKTSTLFYCCLFI